MIDRDAEESIRDHKPVVIGWQLPDPLPTAHAELLSSVVGRVSELVRRVMEEWPSSEIVITTDRYSGSLYIALRVREPEEGDT